MVGKNIIDRAPNNFEIIKSESKLIDLSNFHSIDNFLSFEKPDLIIHCAGLVGGIQSNISNPAKYLIKNLEIGKNIVLAAKKNNIKNMINLSSSCIYPRNINYPLTENLILTGELEPTNEGYALAKIIIQKLIEYLRIEDDTLNYKTYIPCNLFGKWDKFGESNSHMLPAVIKKIHKAFFQKTKEIEIWGDGKARREFMFASDFADFIWFSINNFEKIPPLINVGLGNDYSIKEYYDLVSKVIGFKGKYNYNLNKPVGMSRKLVDCSKINQLGWKPKNSLNDGIKKTYEYYLNIKNEN